MQEQAPGFTYDVQPVGRKRLAARNSDSNGRDCAVALILCVKTLILCVNAGASAWRQEASDRQEFGYNR